MLKVFKQLNSFKERIAIESEGSEFSYAQLIERSDLIASFLLDEEKDLMEERIGFLMRPNVDIICTLWGIWKA